MCICHFGSKANWKSLQGNKTLDEEDIITKLIDIYSRKYDAWSALSDTDQSDDGEVISPVENAIDPLPKSVFHISNPRHWSLYPNLTQRCNIC